MSNEKAAQESVVQESTPRESVVQEKVIGTMGLENKLRLNEGRVRYDEVGKAVLRYKEVLANILKYSIPEEFAALSVQKVMGLIDADSISNDEPVKPDTDTRISGDDTVQTSISEANLTYDVKFKVLSANVKQVHLHVDIELQGNYYPGYPLEKRGIYNLSRMISSQLDVINKNTNYDKLEKVYCIFICVGRVPENLKNTVSYYGMTNKKNVGKVEISSKNYDLMDLILIRIGESIPEKTSEIIRFLHGIFYDIEDVEEYIDFDQNEELRKEIKKMSLTGDHLIEYGMHLQQEKDQQVLEEEKNKAQKLQNDLEDEKKKTQKAQKEQKELEEEKDKAQKALTEMENRVRMLEEELRKNGMR